MNEERKNEIARAVSNMEFFPVPVEDNLELVTYEKIPLNRLNSIGVGFDSLQRIIQNAANNLFYPPSKIRPQLYLFDHLPPF
jgi:hypothetical protein